MKTLIKIVLIGMLAYILQFFLPWWNIVVASVIINLAVYTGGWRSFLSGFWGIFLLWLIAAWVIDMKSHSILTNSVAKILQLPNSFLLIILTAFIAGLCAGFAALASSLFLNLFRKKRSGYYYS